MTASNRAPVRVEGRLDEPLSRWLWLVKWLLALPHFLVLAVLWPVFLLLTAVAFFAILFTGRYPRALFDFNLGVLRWSWRVHFYAYAALGTDRYPPFTLADVPDYPARLHVEYPPQLSRGLVLVKWWLLALPHYLVVGLFVGGGFWALGGVDNNGFAWGAGGLVGILVLVAAVVLAVTGGYPKQIYNFVVGMDRWAVRVAAYAALMTDQYPPFRLDMGGADPNGPVTEPTEEAPAGALQTPRTPDWTAGRITAVVVGAVLVLGSMGLLTGGGAMLGLDRFYRDSNGFLSVSSTLHASGYAVASEPVQFVGSANEIPAAAAMLGDVRIDVRSPDADRPIFVGIASEGAVTSYLNGVAHTSAREFAGPTTIHGGHAPRVAPDQVDIWVAEASGPGTQTVYWPVQEGRWRVVALNADASAGVDVDVRAGVRVPALPWIASGIIVLGLVLLAAGSTCIVVAVHRAARASRRPTVPAAP